MAQLRFRFKDFVDEINAISRMAGSFISPDSTNVLNELRVSLEEIQDLKSEGVQRWSIRENHPLRTKTSEGKYERGRPGRYHVYAEVTSLWEIQALRARKKAQQWREFALAGIASTCVKIIRTSDVGQPKAIAAMWRMEVADDEAPGCYFHVQMRGEMEDFPFPKSLSVPRLPVFLATPAVAFEYVLSELFQEEWEQRALREDEHLQRWRTIQFDRLMKFLDWQKKGLDNNKTLGSPWVGLKRLKPNPTLFLEGP